MSDEDLINGNETTNPETESQSNPTQESSPQPQEGLTDDSGAEASGGAESISSILDAFAAQRNGDTTAAPATVAPKTPAKPAAQHDDLLATQPVTKPAVAPVVKAPPGAPPTVERNYEGLTEEETSWFAGMRNSSYNALYPRFLKMKEMETQHQQLLQQVEENKGAHFYQQEGAWQLSPEYQQIQAETQGSAQEVSFWEQQLEKIETGEKWSKLLRNTQTGELFASEPLDPTPQSRSLVLSKLNRANVINSRATDKLETYEAGFKEKHSGYVSQLRKIELDVCGGAENLKKLERMLPDRLKQFPAHVRNMPEVRTLGLAWLLLDAVMKHSNARAGQAAANGISVAASRTAGPGRTMGGAGTRTGSGTQTIGDIQKQFALAKQGLV